MQLAGSVSQAKAQLCVSFLSFCLLVFLPVSLYTITMYTTYSVTPNIYFFTLQAKNTYMEVKLNRFDCVCSRLSLSLSLSLTLPPSLDSTKKNIPPSIPFSLHFHR